MANLLSQMSVISVSCKTHQWLTALSRTFLVLVLDLDLVTLTRLFVIVLILLVTVLQTQESLLLRRLRNALRLLG